MRLSLSHSLLCVSASTLAVTLTASAQFAPVDSAELALTAAPGAPGAPALILMKEHFTEDNLHMDSFYYRIKVLNEGGKEYANVELPYVVNEAGVSVDSIAGRTIHPDGTIVPFTGKPYDKLLAKGSENSFRSKVFTLPQVEVGSIVEYRYKIHYDGDNYQNSFVIAPDWMIQEAIPIRKAHFAWKPTGTEVMSHDGGTAHVAWAPVLPPGVKVEQKTQPVAGFSKESGLTLDLVINDVPALVHESMMPPLDSLSYRVLFYYTSARTAGEYWDQAGKEWSKAREKFIGPGNAVRAQASALTAPGNSQEQNLKAIYDFVMTLENTSYTRSHSQAEDRASGFKKLASTEDVLARKRGADDEITELFVALARAAGMKAYVMGVSNRSHALFMPTYLSTNQLEDLVAIVVVDGKEVFFDPGQRYCTFKHLAWQHSLAAGLRQLDGGKVGLVNTPGEPYTSSSTKRLADLAVDEAGLADGTVSITYTGDPALRWRQQALRGDDTSLNHDLRENLESRLPGGVEVRVVDVQNLSDGDKPLVVKYVVKGPIGSSTGKRLLLPESLFEANDKPLFTAPKRELPIDFHYGDSVQDAVRYKYPATLAVESVPVAATEKLSNIAIFAVSAKPAPGSVTLYRNLTVGHAFFGPDEYTGLRDFYGKLESKQGESVILTSEKPVGSPAAGTPSGN